MAIQGILHGFGDPEATEQFVALVGRGSNYVVLDGRQVLLADTDLERCQTVFNTVAAQRCKPHWQRVTGLATDSIGCTRAISHAPDKYASLTA